MRYEFVVGVLGAIDGSDGGADGSDGSEGSEGSEGAGSERGGEDGVRLSQLLLHESVLTDVVV